MNPMNGTFLPVVVIGLPFNFKFLIYSINSSKNVNIVCFVEELIGDLWKLFSISLSQLNTSKPVLNFFKNSTVPSESTLNEK